MKRTQTSDVTGEVQIGKNLDTDKVFFDSWMVNLLIMF